ncbi:hypothetical protein [Hyphomonas sp.]|uniref:hypothetical protein n=1 Tax=Hyphomonas sp. TaxID=87 RepID=UPI0025B9CE0F|nr:hypothetical protein [Hyphomonas sp.]MBI1400200.1 hypothetical protein [Hyphomonas sp.]
MHPYSRFRLISNTAATALVAAVLCGAWPVASDMLATATGGLTPVYWAAVAGIAALVVVGSLMLTEWVFPLVFQLGLLRRMVLGRAYTEGTWLQAERGPAGSERLTIVRIRPSGFGFNLSAYSLNQDGEIEGTRMIEYSKLDGPVLSYIFRNLMPDGAGSQAQGANELMFEHARGAPKTYAGYGQAAGAARKFQIEGVKLTRWSERRRLRKLDQRGDVIAKYWNLYFGATNIDEDEIEPPRVHRPVIVDTAQPAFVERRHPDNAPPTDGPVIARRRASDWRSEDATPTADRIRARFASSSALEEDPDEEALEDDDVYVAEAEIEEDDVMIEDEVDTLEDDAEFDIVDEEDDVVDVAEDPEDEVGDEDAFLDEEDDIEADAEVDDDFTDEGDEFEADADDDVFDEEDADADEAEEIETGTGDAPAEDDEPIRIRQRYARRRA